MHTHNIFKYDNKKETNRRLNLFRKELKAKRNENRKVAKSTRKSQDNLDIGRNA